MPDAIIASIAQFGPAGLIGLLWLYERRHGAKRDRQLDQAHRRVLARRRELDLLLKVLQDNTRAINTLELSQRRLIRLLGRLHPGRTQRA